METSERWLRGVLQHEGGSGLLTKFTRWEVNAFWIFLRECFPNRIKESATVRAPVLLCIAFLGFLYTRFCFVEMPACLLALPYTHSLLILELLYGEP